jgi:peptidoglycan/LPS O-acetylase OafA/YrhL
MGATLIVAVAVFLPRLRHNLLSALGDASYSLYLTHALTLSALALLWRYYRIDLPWQLFVLAGCSMAIAIAFCTYNFFEVPVTAMLKSHAHRTQDSAMVGTVDAKRHTQER